MSDKGNILPVSGNSRSISYCPGFILWLILGMACFTTGYAQGVAVTPSRIFFNGEAGQTITQTVRVTNTDSSSLVLNASLKDWDRDSMGIKHYAAPDTKPGSNAGWIRINPLQLTLAPGASSDVRVSMKVPADPEAVTRSMLFLTQVNASKPITGLDQSGRKVNIRIKVEIGIQLYNCLPALQRTNLEFIRLEDRGLVSDTSRVLAAQLQNDGQLPADAFLRTELTHSSTGKTLKVPSRAVALLPGSRQWVLIRIPVRLPSGTYQASLILDGGEKMELKVAQKEIRYD